MVVVAVVDDVDDDDEDEDDDERGVCVDCCFAFMTAGSNSSTMSCTLFFMISTPRRSCNYTHTNIKTSMCTSMCRYVCACVCVCTCVCVTLLRTFAFDIACRSSQAMST